MNTFYEFWRQWFAQPEAEKLKHLRQPGRGGFYPIGSEAPGYTGKPDPKEYFHWRILKGHPGGAATEDLFWECWERAECWLADRGLDELAAGCKPDDCVLRILHYLPAPDGLVGQAHRDFDLLTVSVPGTWPGLEVLTHIHEGNRPGVPCECLGAWTSQEEGIQVGEMLEIYKTAQDCYWGTVCPQPTSQGLKCSDCQRGPSLPATTHRVRTAPNTERFKAVFFYLPPMGFELRPGYTADDYLKEALTRAGTINVGVQP